LPAPPAMIYCPSFEYFVENTNPES